MESTLIKVSLVEDATKVRESLRLLIDSAKGFCCVSSHPHAEHALQHLPSAKPDVVLMDIKLPRLSGIECVRRLKINLPGTQVIMLTEFQDDELIFESLKAGASGYMLKRSTRTQLLEAIRDVHSGGSPLSGEIARRVVRYFQQAGEKLRSLASLTPREKQVLGCLVDGQSYKEIADALGIKYDTIRTHIRNIYDKLQINSRAEAAAKFLSG